MILILIKITKGKKQQEDFLDLINSSLKNNLNEYEEYRQFFEKQCEILFSDEQAFQLINKNPRKEPKLEKSINHDEIKDNYIYLLERPDHFKKINFEEMPKIKKLRKESEKNSKDIYKESKNRKTKAKKEQVKEKEKEKEKPLKNNMVKKTASIYELLGLEKKESECSSKKTINLKTFSIPQTKKNKKEKGKSKDKDKESFKEDKKKNSKSPIKKRRKKKEQYKEEEEKEDENKYDDNLNQVDENEKKQTEIVKKDANDESDFDGFSLDHFDSDRRSDESKC